MKLLFLVTGIHPFKGGIQRYNYTLVEIIKKLNYDISVRSIYDERLTDVVNGDLQKKSLPQFIREIIFDRNTYGTIIIGHRNFLPLVPILKLLHPRATIILIAHGIEIWENQTFMYRVCYSFLHKVWAVSTFTNNKLYQQFRVQIKSIVIPNVLPTSMTIISTKEIDEKHNDQEKRINILSVCRLESTEKYKGVEETIRAIGELKKDQPNALIYYTIVSQGNDVERHKLLSKELNLEDSILFKTGLSDVELTMEYKRAHLFCLPSTGEGFGIVYLEAMSHGAICLGANAGGATDVIQHNKNGILMDVPLSIEKLADEIQKISNDSNKRKILAHQAILDLHRFSFSTVSETVQHELLRY